MYIITILECNRSIRTRDTTVGYVDFIFGTFEWGEQDRESMYLQSFTPMRSSISVPQQLNPKTNPSCSLRPEKKIDTFFIPLILQTYSQQHWR